MTAHDVDAAVAAHAARQASCFNLVQVRHAGGTRRMIEARLATGQWERAGPDVFCLRGAPPDPRRRLWIPHLAIGAASIVSHEAAAELNDLRCFPVGRATLLVPHGTHLAPAGATVHQTRDPWPPPTRDVDGLPVATIPETFVQLAAHHGPKRLAASLEDATLRSLVTEHEVAVRLAGVARRGKPGVRVLGAVLDRRQDGRRPRMTQLESLLHDAIAAAGLPPFVAQFAHPGRDLPGRCVDAADPTVKLILEADGRWWHARVEDLKRDHHRDQEAARLGWLTLRLVWEHLAHDLAGSARLIADVHAVRAAHVA